VGTRGYLPSSEEGNHQRWRAGGELPGQTFEGEMWTGQARPTTDLVIKPGDRSDRRASSAADPKGKARKGKAPTEQAVQVG
jgi:hypothetical protein